MWGQSAGYIWWFGPKSLFGLYIFESMDDGKVERQGQDRGGGNSMVYGGKARALEHPTITTPAPYSRKTGYILGAKGKAHMDNRTGHTHTEWLIGGQVYDTIKGKSRNNLLSKTGHVRRQRRGTCGGKGRARLGSKIEACVGEGHV